MMYLTASDTGKRLLTLDAFLEAAKYSPLGARLWVAKLEELSIEDFDIVLSQVPDSCITQLTRDFAKEMLVQNRQRIIDGFRSMELTL